jgi:hypothetical protein
MRSVLVLLATLLGSSAVATAGEGQPARNVALDLERGSFRVFVGWKTPVLVSPKGEIKPLLEARRKELKDEDRKPVPVRESSRPPKDWAGLDFDDTQWPRARGLRDVNEWGSLIDGNGASVKFSDILQACNPAEWDVVCLRGRFSVEDPAQVKDLRLALSYHGGAVVYVNGVELCRAHVAEGRPETGGGLGERYPDEAYVTPDGRIYTTADAKTFADRIKTRKRGLGAAGEPSDVSIPASLLKKGANVLAVEVRRAPLSELSLMETVDNTQWKGGVSLWPHACVLEARLTSTSNSGLLGPGQAIEISNSSPLETLYLYDYAASSDPLHPIRLVGARNGTFSGKVILNSAAAIRNLKASASELAQEGGAGRIPAAALQVRWAEPARSESSWLGRYSYGGVYYGLNFDRLLSDFPSELAPLKVGFENSKWQPAVPLAVVPIWVTVHVPADAPAGVYRGTLSLEAQGGTGPAKFAVPVQLKVHGWKVPDPKDFTIFHSLYQSPDSVAIYYKVPMWSEKHWELIGKSFEALAQLGNKTCAITLMLKSPHLENAEPMVRWIKKAGRGYDYDFAIMEKYLDVYAAKVGKPGLVSIYAWDNEKECKGQQHGVGVYDAATGKTEPLIPPAYGTPENEAFWKPAFTELRQRLEKRGWFDVAALADVSYCWGPTKETVSVYKNIWPDGKWVRYAHSHSEGYAAKDGSMPVSVAASVWGAGTLYSPDQLRAVTAPRPEYPRPWKKRAAHVHLGSPRYGVGFTIGLWEGQPLSAFRTVTEATLQGNLLGVGCVGGDLWPIPIGKDGRLAPLTNDVGGLGPKESTKALISPGPNGAIFSARSEMFREGVQVAEAIVFLQRALETKQAQGELAGRIASLLDERARAYFHTQLPGLVSFYNATECGWQERDDQLFALCAEVSKDAGAR